jgi:hypothetical protein
MKKIETLDYYECKRCKITSKTKDQLCPCPRGGCEAKIVGKVIKTEELILNDITQCNVMWCTKEGTNLHKERMLCEHHYTKATT